MLTQVKNKNTMLEQLKNGKAVTGIELSTPDTTMMNYLNFLFKKLAVKEMRFIHVVPSIQFFAFGNTTTLDLDEQLIVPIQKAINQTFNGTKVGKAELEIKSGNPLDELLAEVNEEDAGLVVIGQKENGHHNIKARQIARKANCNVLVIPENADDLMDHIIVPVDFSENSKKAFQTAIAIQEEVNPLAKITLVYVYELPSFSTYRISRRPEEIQNQVMEDRQIALNKFIKKADFADAKNVHGVVIEKNNPGIAQYILKFARNSKADFIVMGAQGHSAFENFWLGSVAENLLSQNNDIATLLVRS